MSANQRFRIVLILVVTLLFVVYALLVFTKHITQDEGVFLTIGKYISQGMLPYQDFFDHKPPAIYFLFALLLKIFGTNIFVIKIALVFSILGSSTLIYKISETVKKGSGWMATGLFLFLMTQFEGYFAIAEPFLLFPLLLSLFILLRVDRDSRWRIISGIALAIAILFKQTAILSAIPLIILACRSGKKSALFFVGGLVIPFLAFGAYLLTHNIVDEAFKQIITATLTSYPREPLHTVISQISGTFLWTLPIWALLLVATWVRMDRKYVLWSLVLLPLPAMVFRHYPHYWVQVLPFVAILAALAVQALNKKTLTVAVMACSLLIGGGKILQEGIPHYKMLREQLRVAKELQTVEVDRLLAENQFTAFYFLLPQRPLNNYLYLTEITEAENAEQQTIVDLKNNSSVLVLWPMDSNYAYAKDLQAQVLGQATEETVFESLGMRAIRYISR